MRLNLAQALIGAHDADRAALVCADQTLDYGELRSRVARAATVWRRHGLVAGDRVAVQLADGIDWVIAFLGVIWAGGVAAGVNPRIPADDWRDALDEAQFRFVLAESTSAVPQAWRDRVLAVARWRAEVDAAAPGDPAQLEEDEPAFWTASSGTTGRAKAIVHAHRAAATVERAGVERLGLRGDDRLFASSRLFFCYPLANSLLAGLKIGATVILDPAWPTPAEVMRVVAAQRPTVFFSVPSFYRDLLRQGGAAQLPALGLRLCVSAGEALPTSVRQAWQACTGLGIANGYGASETLTLALIDVDGQGDLRASPGVQIAPLQPDGRADDAAPMRIHIRTPTLALGYWRRPEAQAQSFRDGGYAPADLFTRGAADRWHYAGREDALVKVRGRWVDLAALDERLGTCPGVAEAACVLVPDGDGVDAIALFYVPERDGPPGVESALRLHVARWPAHQRPFLVQAIETLPRTATGKLMRRRLVDLATAGGMST